MVTDLEKRFSVDIPVIQPFNYLYTFWKPSHFYTGLENHTKSCTWRTFRIDEYLYIGAKIENFNDYVKVRVYSNRDIEEKEKEIIINRIISSYGLNEPYDVPIKEKYSDNLKELLYKYEGTRISCPESLYEMSIISLVLQNATINRTIQMLSNLLDKYGKTVRFDGQELKLFFCPSEMVNVNETELKDICRLGYRYKYIIPYSNFFSENKEDYLMSLKKKELLKKLQEIKGVGLYTSNILASHVLHSKSNVGLDCWNTKLIGKFLYGKDNITIESLYKRLNRDYGGNAGIICTYIIENIYEDEPATPLINEEKGQILQLECNK